MSSERFAVVRRIGVALVVCGLAASSGCSRNDGDEVSVGQPGETDPAQGVPGAPLAVAVTEDGTRWAVVGQGPSAPMLLFAVGAGERAAQLEGGAQDRVFGVEATPFADGLAVASIACDDAPCNAYSVNVDIGRLDGTNVVTDRRWRIEGRSSAGAPSVVASTPSTLTILVGGEVLVFEDGRDEVERFTLRVEAGDPCVVGDAVVAVAPAGGAAAAEGDVGAPTTLAGPEAIQVIDLRSGSVLGGSRLEYDPDALAPRCVAGHLVVSPDDQPATFEWAPDGWSELPDTQDVSWTVGPREDALGLVGAVGSSAVRIDAVTGDALASVEPPPDIQGRWDAGPQPLDDPNGGPLGDLIAIGPDGSDVAVVCYSRLSGDRSEVFCA